MSIYKNNKKVIAVYKGATPIKSVFKGSQLVFGDSESGGGSGDEPTQYTLTIGDYYHPNQDPYFYTIDSSGNRTEYFPTEKPFSIDLSANIKQIVFEGMYVREFIELPISLKINNIYGYFLAYVGETLNASNLDLSQCNTINYLMFNYNEDKIKHVIFDNWKVQNINSYDYNTTTSTIFFNIRNSLESVSMKNWNLSSLSTAKSFFSGLKKLKSVDLSGWNTSNITSMEDMFYQCNNLISLDLSSFNTSNVTNVDFMFSECSALTELNVSGWDVLQITNYDLIFWNCNSLQKLILGEVTQAEYDWWVARLGNLQSQVTIEATIV
jgi:surface protein